MCGLCPSCFLVFGSHPRVVRRGGIFFLTAFFQDNQSRLSLALYHGAYFTVIMEWRNLIGCCVNCPVPIFRLTILPFLKIRPSVNRFLLLLAFLVSVDGDDGDDGDNGDDGDDDDGYGNNGKKSA